MADAILVVDDNELNRELLRVILEYSGYEVIEAGNGEECLQMLRAHLPSLVLMDVQMPVMDGVAALKTILSDVSICQIPVAAITSYAMKGDRERLLRDGFVDYIAKPIDKGELLHRIQTILGARV